MDQEKIEKAAQDIRSWVEDAVFDLTEGSSTIWSEREAEAEDNFNDPDTLQDLCGDRIFDEATRICGSTKDPDHNAAFIAIAEEMKKRSHSALVTALNKLIERRS